MASFFKVSLIYEKIKKFIIVQQIKIMYDRYVRKEEFEMVKKNDRLINRIYVFLDIPLVILCYVAAYYLRFNLLQRYSLFQLAEHEKYYPLYQYAKYLLGLVPSFLVSYSVCGLYRQRARSGKRWELFRLLCANILGILLFLAYLYFMREIDISRGFLGAFFALNYMIGASYRLILASILGHFRRKGLNLKHVLLVGYSYTAENYIDRVVANPEWGYRIYGILDDTMELGTRYKKIPVVGTTADLQSFLEKNTFDEITVTLSIDEYSKLKRLVGICEKSGVHTKLIPDYHEVIPTIPAMEDMDGLPVINIRNVPLSNLFNRFVKRAADLVLTIICLAIAAIPMAVVAVIIKATSPGPIIFSQIRVGLHNREFKMYKFRSMEVQSESKEKSAWTTKHDPRVTKIGRLIRRTSIDELPQLWNVLRGDMSLIGPRPERPFFVEKFKEEVPRYMIKHQVRPGMTGWAQVNGYRGDTSIRKRIDCDLYYIENWTLGLDIKILFLTVFKGFINRNAY